jgi:PRTRC genetic system protein B
MKLDLGSTATYVPVSAVMVYRQVSRHQDSDNYVLFEHQAYVDGGRVRLGEGRVADERSVKEIVRKFSAVLHAKPHVLHPRVLVDVPGLFAWWLPAGRRIHYFDVDRFHKADGRERLQGRKATLPHPALVFAQSGHGHKTTRVYALKESARPNADTELCMAPCLNVNTDGWICWGSTALPEGSMHDTFQQWEEAFFSSTFSHINQTSMVNAGERSMYDWLADLCDTPPDVFPVEVLKPVGTLGAVIHTLAKGVQ